MNDGMEYARLIGIPSPSCEYVTKKKKLTFFRKKSLIKKVNDELDETKTTEPEDARPAVCEGDCERCLDMGECACKTDCDCDREKTHADKRERRLSGIITAQVVAALMLVAAIIVTNVFWENSGMNSLIRSVFGQETTNEIADERVYSDFSLNLPVKNEGVTLVKGVISVVGEYSLYPVCEGTVDNIVKNENGTYTVTVKHSENFSSVIEGADLVYFSKGEKVNKNVPVCHTSEKASVYLYDGESLLTDFAATENSIVFNK